MSHHAAEYLEELESCLTTLGRPSEWDVDLNPHSSSIGETHHLSQSPEVQQTDVAGNPNQNKLNTIHSGADDESS